MRPQAELLRQAELAHSWWVSTRHVSASGLNILVLGGSEISRHARHLEWRRLMRGSQNTDHNPIHGDPHKKLSGAAGRLPCNQVLSMFIRLLAICATGRMTHLARNCLLPFPAHYPKLLLPCGSLGVQRSPQLYVVLHIQ